MNKIKKDKKKEFYHKFSNQKPDLTNCVKEWKWIENSLKEAREEGKKDGKMFVSWDKQAYQKGYRAGRKNIMGKIGFLRQYLNERTSKKLITNEDLSTWLI